MYKEITVTKIYQQNDDIGTITQIKAPCVYKHENIIIQFSPADNCYNSITPLTPGTTVYFKIFDIDYNLKISGLCGIFERKEKKLVFNFHNDFYDKLKIDERLKMETVTFSEKNFLKGYMTALDLLNDFAVKYYNENNR